MIIYHCTRSLDVKTVKTGREHGSVIMCVNTSPVTGRRTAACYERLADCTTAVPASVSDTAVVTPPVDCSAVSNHHALYTDTHYDHARLLPDRDR